MISVCETILNEKLVSEDVPDCVTVHDDRCMDMGVGQEPLCQKVPRQVCKIRKTRRNKVK